MNAGRDERWLLARVGLGLGLLSCAIPAAAQYERPQQELTLPEKEAIEINRKLAGPRQPTRRPSLSPTEAARVAVFKGARHSVVFISSITKKWFLEDNRTGNRYQVPPASGTGFVWDNLGHVVTNHHVITIDDPAGGPRGEAEDLQVTLADGKTYKALVIGRSLTLDIAVLHVFAPLEQLKPLPLGTSRDLQVGQMVMAIGNPFGLDHTLTSGVISALGRDILTGFSTHIVDAVQTDAAINPGNSGGPLLDRAGRLIGMNTAIRTTTGISAGVGFAIPVDTLNRCSSPRASCTGPNWASSPSPPPPPPAWAPSAASPWTRSPPAGSPNGPACAGCGSVRAPRSPSNWPTSCWAM